MTTRFRWLGSAAVALALLGGTVPSGCAPEPSRPNLIVITLDTTRADRIGCYGYTGAHTPHLDRIASEGILFEDALTCVPVTLPAHTTMMTGQYPLRHGVRNNGSYRVRPESVTLAELAEDAGYQTAAFVSAYVLDAQFGIAQGFQTYDDDLFNERPGPRTTERAIAWLGRRGPEPFFLWVHLFDPHTPWTPAAFGRGLDLRDDYDREIAVADDCVGQILAALGDELDRSVVMVLADHGEGLDDHGEAEHGIFLYGETTRIPWLLRLPSARAAGTRVRTGVGTVDLFPTLAELAGLSLPATPLDGVSLVPLLEGGPEPERRGRYMETVYPRENFGWSALAAFQSEGWKWIDAPEPELYRLPDDPGEQNDLAERDTTTARTLEGRLARFRALIGEPPPPSSAGMSPEVEERLRSLGYLSGGAAVEDDEDLPDPKAMIAIHADFEDAKRAMDEGRFGDAIPSFRRVLAGNPKNTTAQLGLGTALVRVARFEEAEAVLAETIESRPRNTTVQATLADALFGAGRYREALELYELAESDPSLGTRHVPSRIVVCLERLGRSDEADRRLQGYAGRTADVGFWQDFAGRLQRDRILSRDLPPSADPASVDPSRRIERATVSAGLGILGEAARWLDNPAKDPRVESQRLSIRTQLYAETRRPERALESLEALAAIAPLDPARLRLRAELLLRVGRPEEALSRFAALPPEVPAGEIRIWEARALASLGRKADAVRAIRAAFEAGYGDAEGLYTDPSFRSLRSFHPFADLADSLVHARD